MFKWRKKQVTNKETQKLNKIKKEIDNQNKKIDEIQKLVLGIKDEIHAKMISPDKTTKSLDDLQSKKVNISDDNINEEFSEVNDILSGKGNIVLSKEVQERLKDVVNNRDKNPDDKLKEINHGATNLGD